MGQQICQPINVENPWSAYHGLYMYMNANRAPLLLQISTYYYYPFQTTGIQNELQHYWAPNPSSTQRWLLQSVQKKDGCTSKHTMIHEWPTDRAISENVTFLLKKRSAFSLDIFRHFFYTNGKLNCFPLTWWWCWCLEVWLKPLFAIHSVLDCYSGAAGHRKRR